MRPHRIIAEFIYAGSRITGPGEWTPPSDLVASRLIAAGCLLAAPEPARPPVAPQDITAEAPIGYQEAIDEGAENGRGRRGNKRRDR